MPPGRTTSNMERMSLGKPVGCGGKTPSLSQRTEWTPRLKPLFVSGGLRLRDRAPCLRSAEWPWTPARSLMAFFHPVSLCHLVARTVSSLACVEQSKWPHVKIFLCTFYMSVIRSSDGRKYILPDISRPLHQNSPKT